MLKSIFSVKNGIIMPLVLIVVTSVIILGFAAIFLLQSQATMNAQYSSNIAAVHYAETGIHKYLWYLNKEGAVRPEFSTDIPFEEGFYRLQLVEKGNGYEVIKSTGWKSGSTKKRTIKVVFTKRSFTKHIYLSHDDGDIVWTDGERCYGPYHTNNSLNVSGSPIFYGKVTYSNAINIERGSNPVFKQGFEKITPLIFPTSNNNLKLYAESAGHIYSGLTRIFLRGDTYDVVYYDKNNKLTVEKNKSFPLNGVIYVEGIKGSKFNQYSGNLFISGSLNGRLTIAAANNIFITSRNPTIDNYEKAEESPGLIYETTTFNLNRETGECIIEGDDMLGLIANNYIYILGDGWFDNYWRQDVASENITIHAALFSINEGFQYETYDQYNEKGYITLRGALIQKERKAVGKTIFYSWWEEQTTGYKKDYAHDSRMLFTYPPNFLEPENSGWEIGSWKEVTG